ncbi:MAG: glycosyltransferase family 9 protein [Candidatus Hydrogenedentota bacterium]
MITLNMARWIDRKIGRPICFLISILIKFRKRKIPDLNKVKKILIVKMFGFGTIILASPVFKIIKDNCADVKLYFLTLSQNKNLYDGSRYLDDIIYFDISSITRCITSFIRIVAWLWKERCDVVFDFEIASRATAIISFLSFKSLTVGYAPAGSGKDIFDVTIPYNESIHITRIFLRSLDAVGFRIKNINLLELPITDTEKNNVNNFLFKNNITDFIVFNPNTSELAMERMWPLEYFASLAKKILNEYNNIKLILVGAREDKERCEIVKDLIRDENKVFLTTGIFSIRETAFLLSKAKVFISNDSGPLHLGVLAGVPTIGLFGPETPVLYGPLGEKHKTISSGELCSPCITTFKDKVVTCKKNAICMKKITVEQVFDAVKEKIISG